VEKLNPFRKKRRLTPNEVFTPRSPEVNEKMYISRPELERQLTRALTATKHVVMHGESGCGKSWLYKKVLSDLNMKWELIDLALAANKGSISKEIESVLARRVPLKRTEYTEKQSLQGSAAVIKGAIENTDKFVISSPDPLEQLLESMAEESHKKRSCLVFDNLETIYSNKNLMDELGNMIILLDNPVYAKHQVIFLIVGVPNGVIQYFSGVSNLSTITNRLSEMPEVAKLSLEQVKNFVDKGFRDQLDISFPNEEIFEMFSSRINWATGGIPQRLHEYCAELSYLIEDNDWQVEAEFLDETDKIWLSKYLTSKYVVIDSLMNSRRTEVQRRNQILYCLGTLDKRTFTVTDVEVALKREFPENADIEQLSNVVTQTLKFLDTIVSKTLGNSWTFIDPLYHSCIRVMLQKTSDGKVNKINIEQLTS